MNIKVTSIPQDVLLCVNMENVAEANYVRVFSAALPGDARLRVCVCV